LFAAGGGVWWKRGRVTPEAPVGPKNPGPFGLLGIPGPDVRPLFFLFRKPLKGFFGTRPRKTRPPRISTFWEAPFFRKKRRPHVQSSGKPTPQLQAPHPRQARPKEAPGGPSPLPFASYSPGENPLAFPGSGFSQKSPGSSQPFFFFFFFFGVLQFPYRETKPPGQRPGAKGPGGGPKAPLFRPGSKKKRGGSF